MTKVENIYGVRAAYCGVSAVISGDQVAKDVLTICRKYNCLVPYVDNSTSMYLLEVQSPDKNRLKVAMEQVDRVLISAGYVEH